MPNRVTAAAHEQRSLVPRHTRLLKLRSEGEIVGGWPWKGGLGGRLVVKQLAHTGDSPPVTNSTWIHTRHVRQIQTSLMLGEKNDRDFRHSAPHFAPLDGRVFAGRINVFTFAACIRETAITYSERFRSMSFAPFLNR